MTPQTVRLDARSVVILGAVTLCVLGVLFLYAPDDWAAVVDLQLTTPLARADIRAVYGGLELALGGVLLTWAFSAARLYSALELHMAIWAGLAGGRALGLTTAPAPLEAGAGLFATELIGLALAWSAWIVVRRCADPSHP